METKQEITLFDSLCAHLAELPGNFSRESAAEQWKLLESILAHATLDDSLYRRAAAALTAAKARIGWPLVLGDEHSAMVTLPRTTEEVSKVLSFRPEVLSEEPTLRSSTSRSMLGEEGRPALNRFDTMFGVSRGT